MPVYCKAKAKATKFGLKTKATENANKNVDEKQLLELTTFCSVLKSMLFDMRLNTTFLY